MDSFSDDSLNTTASSLDLGTTFEEPECFTSTPLKGIATQFLPGDVHPLGPPPPKPTGPKPKTVVRRLTIKAIATSLSADQDTTELRLRTVSFKRQRLDYLQKRTTSLRARGKRIKRRHTELRHHRSKMAANSSGSSMTDSDSDVSFSDTSLVTLSSCRALSVCPSQVNFRRNSVTRQASRRRTRRYPLPSLRQADTSTESADVSFAQTNRSTLLSKPLPKVKKTPSLRLKRFVQKKLNLISWQ